MPLTARTLQAYYAASIAFLALDFGLGVNLRVTFLDASPTWRFSYYLFCLVLFALTLWRPAWSVVIGVFETSVTLTALILTMALRVMVPDIDAIEHGGGVVTLQEVFNFVVSGAVAWLAWRQALAMLGTAGSR